MISEDHSQMDTQLISTQPVPPVPLLQFQAQVLRRSHPNSVLLIMPEKENRPTHITRTTNLNADEQSPTNPSIFDFAVSTSCPEPPFRTLSATENNIPLENFGILGT
jgi:hypothetical protein